MRRLRNQLTALLLEKLCCSINFTLQNSCWIKLHSMYLDLDCILNHLKIVTSSNKLLKHPKESRGFANMHYECLKKLSRLGESTRFRHSLMGKQMTGNRWSVTKIALKLQLSRYGFRSTASSRSKWGCLQIIIFIRGWRTLIIIRVS